MNLTMIQTQDKKATRSAFGEAMLDLGRDQTNVIALCADLTGSLKLDKFASQYPDRFFSMGIAEADMIGTAAGLAIAGKIPFATTFAEFATARVYDQIRQSVAYSNLNVKICASHAGLTLGEDGATHQTLEDIGLMRSLPNMTVIAPCDANETYLATHAIAAMNGPVYLRFSRPDTPNFTEKNANFTIGKANLLLNGSDLTLVSYGLMVWRSLLAAEHLQKEGIHARVINMHTIKPMDTEIILKAAKETGAIVTVEEHQKLTGLGEQIAHTIVTSDPVPMELVGVNDTFGESGQPEDLLDKYGLSVNDIVAAAHRVLKRKKR